MKRCSISSAGRPEYCHTTEITGMSISGRMSVGMRRMVTAPRSTMSMAMTTKV